MNFAGLRIKGEDIVVVQFRAVRTCENAACSDSGSEKVLGLGSLLAPRMAYISEFGLRKTPTNQLVNPIFCQSFFCHGGTEVLDLFIKSIQWILKKYT